MQHGKEKQQLEFLFSRGQYPSFSSAPNACLDAPSSFSATAKATGNTNASPPTVEVQEVYLAPHDPRNPPLSPHSSTSYSSGVPTMVSPGDCSEFSDDVADEDKFQGMPSSFRIQTVSVLREGIEDIIIKAAELIVGASIMSCSQIDSSKFISSIYIANVLHRDPPEQLLPKDIKKGKEMRLLITARDKNVYIECIIETEVFVMRCLLHRVTMDFFKAEMCNEPAEINEQMRSIQIEKDSDDVWSRPKTLHYARSIYML